MYLTRHHVIVSHLRQAFSACGSERQYEHMFARATFETRPLEVRHIDGRKPLTVVDTKRTGGVTDGLPRLRCAGAK